MNDQRIESYKEEQSYLRSECLNITYYMKKFDKKNDSEMRQNVIEKFT